MRSEGRSRAILGTRAARWRVATACPLAGFRAGFTARKIVTDSARYPWHCADNGWWLIVDFVH